MMKLVEYHSGEPREDGLHLVGLDRQDAETLCGHAWSGYAHSEIDGDKPTCENCIGIAKELFLNRSGYTKKAVKTW